MDDIILSFDSIKLNKEEKNSTKLNFIRGNIVNFLKPFDKFN